MADDPLDTTTETFDDLVDRFEQSVRGLGGIVETLAGHTKAIAEELVKLKPASAVAELAAATKDIAEGSGEVVGSAAEGAGQAAAVPVAALEDAGKGAARTVESTPAAVFRRKGLKRARRG